MKRTTRLRWRRRVRRSRLQAQDIGVQAEEQLERHFFKRITRLWYVRRFVAGWLALIILLCVAVVFQTRALGGHYLELQPVAGGSHTEGIVGNFTNANPLYAATPADTTISRLIFAGLLTYDDRNRLVGDLAESWKVDKSGQIYTVVLRPDLTWHDGEKLTADDVAFTFQTIQNPDTKSPLFSTWRGITIKAENAHTVSFTLPSPLTPFVYSLTTGIIPEHRLKEIEPAQLRSAGFNNNAPVGSGPFKWNTIETVGGNSETIQQHIGLLAFPDYYRGRPKLDQFIMKTYGNQERMLEAFEQQQITAMVGLEQLPDQLVKDTTIHAYEVPLTAENMAFMRTTSNLLKDKSVRLALIQAVDVPKIVSGLSYPAILADQPLLKGQLAYDAGLRQLQTNVSKANTLLDEAGWKRSDAESVRTKGKTKLSVKLYGKSTVDYTYIARELQNAWQAVGVSTEVILQQDDQLQQSIADRSYDVLLAGIAIGLDPDVFAYWHGSQADRRSPTRFNFSDFSSKVANSSLEAGRSRSDDQLRAIKYKPFLKAWRDEAPAVALFQPRFFYVTKGALHNFTNVSMNSAVDRFASVDSWMVREGKTIKTE